jgi:hypothetical protein
MPEPNSASAIPTPLMLYQMSVGHYVSRALYLMAKLGIADLLAAGARDGADLARATDTHAPSLVRVLRLLVTAGVLEETDRQRFTLTPMGQFLRTDVPGSMNASVMLFAGVELQDSWKELEYCVRTGRPAYRKNSPDADPFVAMRANPEAAQRFDKAMATFAPQTAAAVAAAYDFSSLRKVVDVGGGNGALLIGILKANPKLEGLVFDQAHAIDAARLNIKDGNLETRCEAVAGDFFRQIPEGFDAYILKHVIHDWNDEKAGVILKNCHSAMHEHSRLLIVEGVYPAQIDRSVESRGAAANDVNMLVATGGRQRSEEEFRSLHRASGFELSRIALTAMRVSVIEGTRQ